MDTTTHVGVIAEDLRAAATGDDATVDAVDRLIRTSEASLHLRLLDVLSEAALELSEQLPAGHVEVRLAGRDARFVLVGEAARADSSAPAEGEETGGTARLTLRMPERMKRQVEDAAAGEGLSTNAWLVDAVTRSLDRRPLRRVGARVTGYARG